MNPSTTIPPQGINQNPQQTPVAPKDPKLKIIPSFKDIKNIRKNWKTVKSSPYAALQFSIAVRQILIPCLIVYILLKGYDMVTNYSATGYMQLIGQVIITGVIGFICWKMYETIPIAKKQLAYYKRNPKTINRKDLNVKKEVNDIMDMFDDKTGERRNDI